MSMNQPLVQAKDSSLSAETLQELINAHPVTGMEDGSFTTGLVRLSFPSLFEEDKRFGGYFVSAIFPKNANISPISHEIARILNANFSTFYDSETRAYRNVRLPLQGQAEKNNFTGYDTEGYFLNARSKNPPQVFDSLGAPITKEHANLVYGGVWANLHIAFFAYNKGSRGIGIGLFNVILIANDLPFGTITSSPFGPAPQIEGANQIVIPQAVASTPPPGMGNDDGFSPENAYPDVPF